MIKGYMLNGEFERLVCAIGMVTSWDVYNGPLAFGKNQFSTSWDVPGEPFPWS